MVTTRDGFQLTLGQEYTIVSLDENDQFVESSTRCVYEGHRVQDNTQFLGAVGNNCSGWYPPTVTMHRFAPVVCSEDFEITESRVPHIVVKDESEIEEVVKKRLK